MLVVLNVSVSEFQSIETNLDAADMNVRATFCFLALSTS
jgi:hypothetical protein